MHPEQTASQHRLIAQPGSNEIGIYYSMGGCSDKVAEYDLNESGCQENS